MVCNNYSRYIFMMILQPFAWEAREYVRKKLINKEVAFVVEYTVPGSGREYGCVYLGKGMLDIT